MLWYLLLRLLCTTPIQNGFHAERECSKIPMQNTLQRFLLLIVFATWNPDLDEHLYVGNGMSHAPYIQS